MGEDGGWPGPTPQHSDEDLATDLEPSREPAAPVARLAAAFVEKPDEATAASYLATGDYLWNAGMFVAKASVLMDALERFHPELAWPLREIADAWDGPQREAVVSRHWAGMQSLVIDTAVAEPLAREGGIAVVPVEMGWSDIGDYDSLAEVIDEDARTAQVVPGASRQPVIAQSSPGALVYAGRKPIAIVGIPDAVVVDMDDVLLVTTRQAAQQVKGAVDSLPASGLSDLA
ncbi:MAG: sugar phosphate nucleotidyltransferase [Actinomycetaceae bacterium]|nr:sugar phosphate nucleotidyltransferase [Actinomycetaceae bacterium]